MADQAPESTGDGRFETTDWGLIKVAKGGDSSSARQALSDLCSSYWYPLYVYIRHHGHPADRAQDLTQGFFASLLGTNFLDTISPEKGASARSSWPRSSITCPTSTTATRPSRRVAGASQGRSTSSRPRGVTPASRGTR